MSDSQDPCREALAELLNEFERAACRRDVLHSQYQGKAMPDAEYETFVRLRDETVPGLRRRILATAAERALAQEPAELLTSEQIQQLKARLFKAEAERSILAEECDKLAELTRMEGVVIPGVEPSDPMDWPLPCGVTIGHVTMRKGVRLGTLVARMKVLYEMATGRNADEEASLSLDERRARFEQFQAALSTPAPQEPAGREAHLAKALQDIVDDYRASRDPDIAGIVETALLALAQQEPVTSTEQEPKRIYLVATGEIHEGQETYTRHADAPPQLCDAECLYAAPQPPAASPPEPAALPHGWVPLRVEWERGYPEDVAFGPPRMMDRLKKWLDKFVALRLAEQTHLEDPLSADGKRPAAAADGISESASGGGGQ